MINSIVDRILTLSPAFVYVIVAALVFAEDALFVGFVIPGETAAVLGGVVASQGRVTLWVMLALVVAAAIIGDSVGYEIGGKVGPHILEVRILAKRRRRVDDAQDFLRRRGGAAVFLGRFVAFFRAVMPALAGVSRMRYRTFLAYNALGGLAWGVGYVLAGYLAGHSYKAVESYAGRGSAVVVAVIVVAALIAWRIRRHRAHASADSRGGPER